MEQYIDIKELSAKLDVKPMTIYGWVHAGVIPHVKLEKLVRFNVNDINAWLQQKKVSPRRGKIVRVELE